MVDTDLGYDLDDAGALYMLWETDSTLPNLEVIFQCAPLFNIVLFGGNICVHAVDPALYHTAIQNIQPSTGYLVCVDWNVTSQSGGKNILDYAIKFTELSADGNHTEYENTFTGLKRTANSAQRKQLYLGTAQTTLDSLFGSIIHCKGTATAATKAHAKDFLIKQWRSQATSPQVDPNAVDSDWLCELRH